MSFDVAFRVENVSDHSGKGAHLGGRYVHMDEAVEMLEGDFD